LSTDGKFIHTSQATNKSHISDVIHYLNWNGEPWAVRLTTQ
jgi:hypothetical protein